VGFRGNSECVLISHSFRNVIIKFSSLPFLSGQGVRVPFLFSIMSVLGLGPTQPPLQRVVGGVNLTTHPHLIKNGRTVLPLYGTVLN
jgi:hypothetical protein